MCFKEYIVRRFLLHVRIKVIRNIHGRRVKKYGRLWNLVAVSDIIHLICDVCLVNFCLFDLQYSSRASDTTVRSHALSTPYCGARISTLGRVLSSHRRITLEWKSRKTDCLGRLYQVIHCQSLLNCSFSTRKLHLLSITFSSWIVGSPWHWNPCLPNPLQQKVIL